MSALLELKEAQDKLLGTHQKLKGLMEKKDDAGKLKWEPEDFDRFNSLNDQAAKEHDEVKRWEDVEGKAAKSREFLDELKRPLSAAPFSAARQDNREREPERKSAGQLFIESRGYKSFIANGFSGEARLDLPDYGMDELKASAGFGGVETKTVMTTAAGYLPFVTRGSDVVPYALRRAIVQNLMPSFNITERGIEYMEETLVTENAAAVAEGASKPESARELTPRAVNAEVVATTLPVTEQQLADAPFIMQYINTSLGSEIERKEEYYLLNGTGSTPQLQGYLTKSDVLTQSGSEATAIVDFMSALTKVRYTGYAEPDAGVFHPNDWMAIITTQEGGTGRFLFGDPSAINVNRLWGVPIVVTPSMTENTALVGDFRTYSYRIQRMGLKIDIGWVNDDFKKNKKTIRAEIRSNLVIRRPQAYCKITGI